MGHLKTKGENTTESGVKDEINRVKQAMLRLKNLEDKANWSGIDKAAAKRFVKSGLWQPKEKEEEGGKNLKRQRRN